MANDGLDGARLRASDVSHEPEDHVTDFSAANAVRQAEDDFLIAIVEMGPVEDLEDATRNRSTEGEGAHFNVGSAEHSANQIGRSAFLFSLFQSVDCGRSARRATSAWRLRLFLPMH